MNTTMPVLASCNLETDASSLIARIKIDGDDSLGDQIIINFDSHDDIAREFFASFPCTRTSDGWEGKLNLDTSPGQRLLELAQITNRQNERVIITKRRLFYEPSTDGPWDCEAAANAEYQRLEAARVARFDTSLIADNSADSDPRFMVLMLADNLHLTRSQQVPGISVLPLTNATLGRDMAEALNAVLVQMGVRQILTLAPWLDLMRKMRPSAIIRISEVHASDAQAARQHCRAKALRLIDLLALRRGDTPHLLGGVVCQADQAGTLGLNGGWVEGPGYAGNLMGGFISGESPHDLLIQWDKLNQDPRIQLWLSLYADAIADERWDYKLFRCFNLLEGAGSELVPSRQPVLDSSGAPRLMASGRPYTTEQARGKIYELVRVLCSRGHLAEGSFAERLANGDPGDLWEEVGLWVTVRNAVAHRGTWRIPASERPPSEYSRVEAEIMSRAINNEFDTGAWKLVNNIRSATQFMLHSAFMGRI